MSDFSFAKADILQQQKYFKLKGCDFAKFVIL